MSTNFVGGTLFLGKLNDYDTDLHEVSELKEGYTSAGAIALKRGLPIDLLEKYEQIHEHAFQAGGSEIVRIGLLKFPHYIKPLAALIPTMSDSLWNRITRSMIRAIVSPEGSEESKTAHGELAKLVVRPSEEIECRNRFRANSPWWKGEEIETVCTLIGQLSAPVREAFYAGVLHRYARVDWNAVIKTLSKAGTPKGEKNAIKFFKYIGSKAEERRYDMM